MVQGPFTVSPITRWTYDLLNAGFLQKGNKANRPTSSVRTNRMMYWAEDTGEVLWSNGTNSGNDLGDGWGVAIAADPAVSVPGLRTLGSGPLQGAPGPHGHITTQNLTTVILPTVQNANATSMGTSGWVRSVNPGAGSTTTIIVTGQTVDYEVSKGLQIVITFLVYQFDGGLTATRLHRSTDGVNYTQISSISFATQVVSTIVFVDNPVYTSNQTLTYRVDIITTGHFTTTKVFRYTPPILFAVQSDIEVV